MEVAGSEAGTLELFFFVFGVNFVVRVDQRQRPRVSLSTSLQIAGGFRGKEGGPDVLAWCEILLAVRARTRGFDFIIHSR
jgi:hypothetical protein